MNKSSARAGHLSFRDVEGIEHSVDVNSLRPGANGLLRPMTMEERSLKILRGAIGGLGLFFIEPFQPF